ncbi:hypothetical protein BLNAU_8451 [Blattamonas nauphoetae]|uniref:Uncharacterized protein n=1 Tax=Blattamonas nauphoetae TaxID=2049346 RepID=A0ABQ9XYP6_9EUKA|nr:hypothetical protein BLNAU_8451 [Blattamonas nauphoetae]
MWRVLVAGQRTGHGKHKKELQLEERKCERRKEKPPNVGDAQPDPVHELRVRQSEEWNLRWTSCQKWTRGDIETRKRAEELEVHDSPPAHLSACLLRGSRSSVSLLVALADNSTTDGRSSLHSSAQHTPSTLERGTRLLVAHFSRTNQANTAACIPTDRTLTQSTSQPATSSPQ